MRPLAVVLALTGVAAAAPPEPSGNPPIFDRCKRPQAWDALGACFQEAYAEYAKILREPVPKVTTTILASVDHARVVQVRVSNDPSSPAFLVIETAKRWHLTHILYNEESAGTFGPITIDGTRGYHFVRHQTWPMEYDAGDGVLLPGQMPATFETFCPPSTIYCEDVMTACDHIVQGRAVATFRGTLHFKDGQLSVWGDTSAQGACKIPTIRE